MQHPVLKYRPEEFLVVEALAPITRMSGTDGRFTYLKLLKCGFTTFEAIEEIERALDLPRRRTSYAGLKDEDAITEQLIGIEGPLPAERLAGFNDTHRCVHRFMELRYHGSGDELIQIGRLDGNNFRLVVRNLSDGCLTSLKAGSRFTAYFLNYYDTQRFGVPGGPKQTHLVGEALMAGDVDEAFECLTHARSPEGQQAARFSGSPQSFFSQLEPRVIDFYKSSYASYQWNTRLASLVREVCGDDVYEYRVDDIPFVLTHHQSRVMAVLGRTPFIEYTRFNGIETIIPRPTAIQVQIIVHAIDADDVYENSHKCEMSFLLPSGCYATMCVRQVVNLVDVD